MCGIVGVFARRSVNQLLYNALSSLQHRGQDAAGIATALGRSFHIHKGQGLVKDVFDVQDMLGLAGNMGIGHCRYPTVGGPLSGLQAQPFYVNSPFGIMLAHNGNLTNSEDLERELFQQDLRHINTHSDSEILLNVLAHELQQVVQECSLEPENFFEAVRGVYRRAHGAYAVTGMISNCGLFAFRDRYGIRPLVIGVRQSEEGEQEYLLASETVTLDLVGFEFLRDVAPGEAIFVDMQGRLFTQQMVEDVALVPCVFEYVYFARPDSVINGVSVYESRIKMGEYLARRIQKYYGHLEIDVVIPIPESSRPSALQLAMCLDLPYREGFVKNRYIGRTFIMPGHDLRHNSVRYKLNTVPQEFRGKKVLLVDDSIVRGTTCCNIVKMAREAGASKVYMASAAPPILHPNVYGIDMPTRVELIASDRSEEEIREKVGVDALIYQTLDDLKSAIFDVSQLSKLETSCFDGRYIAGRVTSEYLYDLAQRRAQQK